jgi:hypothetical protein
MKKLPSRSHQPTIIYQSSIDTIKPTPLKNDGVRQLG